MTNRIRILLAIIIIATLAISCSSCKSPNALEPQPFLDAATWVYTGIHDWLDVRLDEDDLAALASDDLWKNATSIAEFSEVLNQYGNFDRKIVDLLNSERYPIGEEALLSMMKQALTIYINLRLE